MRARGAGGVRKGPVDSVVEPPQKAPPFSTPTLARMYLAQGHLETARAMVATLRDEGAPGLDGLEAELAADVIRRVATLEELLLRVRNRRRL